MYTKSWAGIVFQSHFSRTITRANGSQNVTNYLYSVLDNVEGEYGENPQWRLDIKLRRNATTPMYVIGTRTKISSRRASAFRKATGTEIKEVDVKGFTTNYFHWSSLPNPTGAEWLSYRNTAFNRAVVPFVQKANSYLTLFESGQFLGELRETLKLLTHPLKTLRSGLDDIYLELRKLKKSSTGRYRARMVGGAWLEFAFGVQPLLGDVRKIAQAFAKEDRSYVGRRISTKADYDGPMSVVNNQIVESFLTTVTTEGYGVKSSCILRGYVCSAAKNPVSFTAESLGLDLTKWIPTAYELLPYSWLIDYFTNCGDVIDGWAFQSASLRWVNRTYYDLAYRKVLSDLVKSVSGTQPKGGTISVPLTGSIREKFIIEREKYSGSLTPSLEFRIPGIGSTKWLNIAGLMLARNTDFFNAKT